jgi:CheY-like chemotaxis protein
MNKISIMFFDDLQNASENKSLVMNIKREIQDSQLVTTNSVNGFESAVKKKEFNVIILDIIAPSPRGFVGITSGKHVDTGSVGVELLVRCRAEYYNRNKKTPIFMRSTRRGAEIVKKCLSLGATKYYSPGHEDRFLIEEILKIASQLQ